MAERLRFAVLLTCLCLLTGCGGNTTSGNSPTPSVSMAITSGALPPGTAGVPYDGSGFVLNASGGVAPYHWTWAPQSKSSLPTGVNMSADGLISGTPTLAGAYKVVVTAVDAGMPPSQVSATYRPAGAHDHLRHSAGRNCERRVRAIRDRSAFLPMDTSSGMAPGLFSVLQRFGLPSSSDVQRNRQTDKLPGDEDCFSGIHFHGWRRSCALQVECRRSASGPNSRCEHGPGYGHSRTAGNLHRHHHCQRFPAHACPGQRGLWD